MKRGRPTSQTIIPKMQRMPGDEFRNMLERMGVTIGGFARSVGLNRTTVQHKLRKGLTALEAEGLRSLAEQHAATGAAE